MTLSRGLAVIGLLILSSPLAAQNAPTVDVFPLHIARMYATPTGTAWTQVQRVLKDAGIRTELIDQDNRFLVTTPIEVNRKRFGFEIGSLDPRYQSGRVRLHVFVPSAIEPARVYVSSTLEAKQKTAKGDAMWRDYNRGAFGTWLLDSLTAALAVPSAAVPRDVRQRGAAGERLMPGAAGECGTRLATQGALVRPGRGVQPPTKIHDERPIFPQVEQANRRSNLVIVEMSLGEDGFAWPTRLLRGATADEPFGVASLGAVSQWRYVPTRVDGCPVPMTMTVTVSFTLK